MTQCKAWAHTCQQRCRGGTPYWSEFCSSHRDKYISSLKHRLKVFHDPEYLATFVNNMHNNTENPNQAEIEYVLRTKLIDFPPTFLQQFYGSNKIGPFFMWYYNITKKNPDENSKFLMKTFVWNIRNTIAKSELDSKYSIVHSFGPFLDILKKHNLATNAFIRLVPLLVFHNTTDEIFYKFTSDLIAAEMLDNLAFKNRKVIFDKYVSDVCDQLQCLTFKNADEIKEMQKKFTDQFDLVVRPIIWKRLNTIETPLRRSARLRTLRFNK